MRLKIPLTCSPQQLKFIQSKADETLYGGAAGGGKSHAQMMDAMLKAFQYPGCRQILLRRTYRELDRTLVQESHKMYKGLPCVYNKAERTWRFANGSLIMFGYCEHEQDVYQYDGVEFDIVRFDELTHFTYFVYSFLMGRLRGTNPCPKQMKSSTNPGNVGHLWVKERFVEPADWGTDFTIPLDEEGTAVASGLFIPARVDDNPFLMANDPNYRNRLIALPEKERKAKLYGDWDIFDGQYFSMWKREIHVIQPFPLPYEWRRYVAFDYGRDMFAALFFAMDNQGRAICYREIYEGGLIVSQAAERLKAAIPAGENIRSFFAPPDLWNKHSDTGKSTAEIFSEHGIVLTKVSNHRSAGWQNVAEWLSPFLDEQEQWTAGVRFFSPCVNIIRCLPALQFDEKDMNDVANEPHELTHAPDALRYFLAGRPSPAPKKEKKKPHDFAFQREKPNWVKFSDEIKVV